LSPSPPKGFTASMYAFGGAAHSVTKGPLPIYGPRHAADDSERKGTNSAANNIRPPDRPPPAALPEALQPGRVQRWNAARLRNKAIKPPFPTVRRSTYQPSPRGAHNPTESTRTTTLIGLSKFAMKGVFMNFGLAATLDDLHNLFVGLRHRSAY